MSKVIAAFLGAEVRQTGAEERPEGFGGSTAGGAHEGFELREAEFNGIEVRTVGRQIAERGADALDPREYAGSHGMTAGNRSGSAAPGGTRTDVDATEHMQRGRRAWREWRVSPHG